MGNDIQKWLENMRQAEKIRRSLAKKEFDKKCHKLINHHIVIVVNNKISPINWKNYE